MPILFSAVAYNKDVLSKYASCEGNFTEIVDQVISKIPNKDHKMTYLHGHYLFNYISQNGYLYFCVTAKACQRSRAFLYLNEIKRRFSPDNKEFYHVLASEMQRYSEDYSTIEVRKGEIDELNSIGVDSSESILGEKVLSVDNPDNLCFSTTTCVTESPQQSIISDYSHDFYKQTTAHILNNGPPSCPVQEIDPIDPFDPKDTTKQTNAKFFFIVVTVILFIVWISLSSVSPMSLGVLACVLILSFTRLSMAKDKAI